MRELKLANAYLPKGEPACRTLPRVRELKLERTAYNDARSGRTLPRVRELKHRREAPALYDLASHPSQGA